MRALVAQGTAEHASQKYASTGHPGAAWPPGPPPPPAPLTVDTSASSIGVVAAIIAGAVVVAVAVAAAVIAVCVRVQPPPGGLSRSGSAAGRHSSTGSASSKRLNANSASDRLGPIHAAVRSPEKIGGLRGASAAAGDSPRPASAQVAIPVATAGAASSEGGATGEIRWVVPGSRSASHSIALECPPPAGRHLSEVSASSSYNMRAPLALSALSLLAYLHSGACALHTHRLEPHRAHRRASAICQQHADRCRLQMERWTRP